MMCDDLFHFSTTNMDALTETVSQFNKFPFELDAFIWVLWVFTCVIASGSCASSLAVLSELLLRIPDEVSQLVRSPRGAKWKYHELQ